MENEVVALEPRFYRIYVDDLLTDVRKILKVFFSKVSRIIIKTKLIKEISPAKFLDLKLNCVSGIYKTMVYIGNYKIAKTLITKSVKMLQI